MSNRAIIIGYDGLNLTIYDEAKAIVSEEIIGCGASALSFDEAKAIASEEIIGYGTLAPPFNEAKAIASEQIAKRQNDSCRDKSSFYLSKHHL